MTRVKSGVLVSAALRYANTVLIDCVLARRGDADSGAIFVHIDSLDGRHKLLARSLNFDGEYEWHIITKTEWVDAEATRIMNRLSKAQIDPQGVSLCLMETRTNTCKKKKKRLDLSASKNPGKW